VLPLEQFPMQAVPLAARARAAMAKPSSVVLRAKFLRMIADERMLAVVTMRHNLRGEPKPEGLFSPVLRAKFLRMIAFACVRRFSSPRAAF